LQHGSLLFEQKRYLEARDVLEKARRWNPASAKIAFEYMETYKVVGANERFAELTKGQNVEKIEGPWATLEKFH
ncbi:MAG: hypothetical protein IKW21_00560, partial [Lachnospiraceae bacterium]|nr:hypothetical protein [Lachnospiraceae bacterium]